VSNRANGILGVLDGILSRENQQQSQITTPASTIARLPAAAVLAADNDGLPRQTGSRRGRPLGKATSPALPKEKVTLWLSSPLVASYRDWSWEARSQFSHLVERALTDYYQRQRHPEPTTR
jgi:hypothetical protein